MADTNILLRMLVEVDDPQQAQAAFALLARADRLIVPIVAFCEAVWVMRQSYKHDRSFVAAALRIIINDRKVVVDEEAVSAGLRQLDDGGDFADGVMECLGRRMAQGKACIFASFDNKAVALLAKRGLAASNPLQLGEAAQ
ncbi:MAG: PIN domain-containing protein [Ottowia sp.]|nr:PIN domain-containing protein [Ottowia sp.]